MRKLLVFQFDFWKENILPECPEFVFSISRSGSLLMGHNRQNHILKNKKTKKTYLVDLYFLSDTAQCSSIRVFLVIT